MSTFDVDDLSTYWVGDSPTVQIFSYTAPGEMSFEWFSRAVFELAEVAALLGDPGKIELTLEAPDWSWKRRKFNQKNLDIGLARLTDGTLDRVSVSSALFSARTFLHGELFEERLPSHFDFFAKPDARFQDPLVRALLEGTAATSACTAFLTVDEAIDAYSYAILPPGGLDHFPGFLNYVHGYYWYTVLSPSHIARLAERGRHIEDAPVFRVDELVGDRVGLQLSELMLDYSDEQLLALREFLDPLLRPGRLSPAPRYGRTFETHDRPAT
jgi:hypothetical protein